MTTCFLELPNFGVMCGHYCQVIMDHVMTSMLTNKKHFLSSSRSPSLSFTGTQRVSVSYNLEGWGRTAFRSLFALYFGNLEMLRNVCHYNVHQEFKALQSLATEDPPFLPIHAMNTVYSLITLNHLVPNKSNSLYHGCINWNTVSHCSI